MGFASRKNTRVGHHQVVTGTIRWEFETTRFDVQTTSDIPGSPGDHSGPKRDDELGGGLRVKEAFGTVN